MIRQQDLPWREAVAAVNVSLGAGLALVGGWAWLVCEARHPGGGQCGPTLACLTAAGLLLALAGLALTLDIPWAARAAFGLQALALVPAGLFVVGLIVGASVVSAAAASACWLALVAEAALMGRA